MEPPATSFGSGIVVDGDTLVSLAQIPSETPALQSVIYVFVRDGDNWVQQAQFTTNDWTMNDGFSDVDLDGDTILVGSSSNSSFGGAAYVFVRTGTTWAQQAKIPCPGCTGLLRDFGISVSLEGDTAVIGAQRPGSGSAFVYSRSNGVWSQTQELSPSDGANGDNFGASVVLDGNIIAVGAPAHDIGEATNCGSAYVFARQNDVWTQTAKLTPSDLQTNEYFGGGGMALENETLAIGMPNDRIGTAFGQGSVRLFSQQGTTWTENGALFASDGRSGAGFGGTVGLYGDTLVAGAQGYVPTGSNERTGSAYVFAREGGNWIEVTRLAASDSAPQEGFGNAMIGESGILVGAPADRIDGNPNRGSIYYYRRPTSPPDLRPESDSGVSSTDNFTNARNPVFDIKGLISGSAYEVHRNGVLIDSGTATGTTATFSDPTAPPTDFGRYDVRQTVNGQLSSVSSLFVLFDTVAPVIRIDSGHPDPTSATTVYFSGSLTEPILPEITAQSFSLAESTADVSSATITFIPNGGFYTVAVGNLQSDGVIKLTLAPNLEFRDRVGNPFVSVIADNAITRDSVGPTVAINQAPNQADPTATLPLRYDVTFGEPVTGFDAGDLLSNDSTAFISWSQVSVTGSGTSYVVTLNNVSSDGGFVRLSVRAGAVNDAALNPSSASTSTDNVVVVDNVQPRVTINKAAGQSDPTNASPVRYSVVFTEPVTGFGADDVSLAGSNVSTAGASITVTGSGASYMVNVDSLGAIQGNLVVSVPAGGALDNLGNASRASTSTDNSVFVDTLPPTVAINQGSGQADPSVIQPVSFTAVFSESVTGFTPDDVSLTGSTANVSHANIQIVGSGSVFHIYVRNVTSSGIVRASVVGGGALDLRGNPSTPSVSTDNEVRISVDRWKYDYDGDGRSDLSVRRPSDNIWYLLRGTAGFTAMEYGVAGDRMTPADYDGDGKTDVAVFRPSNGTWYIHMSQSQTFQTFVWGEAGDLPVPTDRDADGRADLVVYRGSDNIWYTRFANETFAQTHFGVVGDKPVVGDFDADGKGDIAVYRPSNNNWYIIKSSIGYFIQTWGEPGDVPITGDFDGDGATDQAVFRPSAGQWWLSQTTAGFASQTWGVAGDIPVAADYDGDGKTDVAIFRPSTGEWYIVNSTAGILVQQFGQNGDVPTQSAYTY